MSSTSFEVALNVDHYGRLAVFWSGAVLGILGVAITLMLPFPWPARVAILLAWTADACFGLYRFRGGWAGCRTIQLSSTGDVVVVDPLGGRQPVVLATGTVVLGSFAWLRYTAPGEHVRGEFLTRRAAGNRAWHRFRVIWRLAKSAFGQPARGLIPSPATISPRTLKMLTLVRPEKRRTRVTNWPKTAMPSAPVPELSDTAPVYGEVSGAASPHRFRQGTRRHGC